MRTSLLLLAALAFSCGSGGGGGTGGGAGGGGGAMARCNTGNCAGCCDSNDVCQLGQSSTACGTSGNACLACGTGLACASGVCVASGTGGGGGSGTGGGGGGGGGSSGPKRIFVTRTAYTGNLRAAGGGASGLEGGDNLCNTAAAAASIGGRWVAWLSSGAVRAFDRVTGTGPWQLVGSGTTVFNNRAGLATTPLAPIDRDETGALRSAYAWTGTSNGGGPSGYDCSGWEVGSLGTLGDPEAPSTWTAFDYRGCSNTYSLICFEQ